MDSAANFDEGTEAPAEISEERLLERLIQEQDLDRDALAQMLQEQERQFQAAQKMLQGTAFVVQPATRTLWIQDFLSGEVLAKIPLAGRLTGTGSPEEVALFDADEVEALHPEDWERWGHALCFLQPEDGGVGHFAPVEQDQGYGLVVTADTSLVYLWDPLHTDVLGIAYQCLYHRVGTGGAPIPAYDLYLSEDRQYLAVSDREGGRVLFLATESRQELGWVQIRPPGSSKALNVAFEFYGTRAFLTDNHSAQLFVLELDEMNLEAIPLGRGSQVFGALLPAPDVRYLFLLMLKPVATLLYLNRESWEFEEEIPLRGNFFTNQQIDPADLMVMTPDQNQLWVLTSYSDPEPFTPAITVIDPHQFQVLHFHTIAHALREQTKPVGLLYPWPNPVLHLQQSPLEMLRARELIRPEWLEQARASLETEDAEAEAARQARKGHAPALEPQQAEFLSLKPELAIPAIVSLLSQKLYQQSEIELAAHPEELARFQEQAEVYRQALEHQDAVEVLLEAILESQRLETLLTRQDVLTQMAATTPQKSLARPPHYCPACQHELRGLWDCVVCGLELESPQRLEKKRASSMSSLGALARYHLLICDSQGQRLLILDDHKTIDWSLPAEDLPWPQPWNALWVNGQNLLVVDREAAQVYLCGPTGKLNWSLKQERPELQLNQPVKASYFSPVVEEGESLQEQILIVDQGNHRVLVVDLKQNLLWQYGVQGELGVDAAYLNAPSDLQWTFDQTFLIADTDNDRVLEIRPHLAEDGTWLTGGQILRSFGAAQGLSRPVYAQRLYDHDTLIVDAGNYRVLEVDLDGEITSECFYLSDEMDAEMRLDHPIAVFRREKKSIVLMDREKMLEILPQQQMLVWSSLLLHLARRVEIRRDAFDKHDSYVQSFDHYRMPTLEELLARLRADNRLGSSVGIAQQLYANLSGLVEQRRERDRERAQQEVQVKVINEARLLKVPIYLLDRSHQQAVRISRQGDVLWHFGAPVTSVGTPSGFKLLRPTHLWETPDSVLIADTSHHRVLEISKKDAAVLHCWGGLPEGASRPPPDWTLPDGSVYQEGYSEVYPEVYAEAYQEGYPDTSLDQAWQDAQAPEQSYTPAPAGHKSPQSVLPVPQLLSMPRSATRTLLGNILIADQGHKRLVEISPEGEELWEYRHPHEIAYPYFALELGKGTILFVDWALHMVKEINREGELIWCYGQSRRSGDEENRLNSPEHAVRLPSGAILIADTGNHRVLEVSPGGKILWAFSNNKKFELYRPVACQRLFNGHTLIAYHDYRALLEVNREGEACWYFELGHGPLVLNGPQKP